MIKVIALLRCVPRCNWSDERHQMTGEVGSYRYMAPELVRHEPYNAKADIYSWAIHSWATGKESPQRKIQGRRSQGWASRPKGGAC